jgi:hypothetical protein
MHHSHAVTQVLPKVCDHIRPLILWIVDCKLAIESAYSSQMGKCYARDIPLLTNGKVLIFSDRTFSDARYWESRIPESQSSTKPHKAAGQIPCFLFFNENRMCPTIRSEMDIERYDTSLTRGVAQ